MSEIPTEVRAAAMRALMVAEHDMVDSVAQAILAERERCAKCCEGDFDSEMRGYGDYFAGAIRASSEVL